MNPTLAYFRRLLKKIDTQTYTGGTGGNPTGGSVEIASTNYLAQLTQQFISLTIGSTSSIIMNLPSSMMEAMNLYLSTFLYAKYKTEPNVTGDFRFAHKTASSSIYLPGLITPAHLKLSCHFNGDVGTIPSSVVSADSPVYNSNTTTAKMNVDLNTYTAQMILSDFVGGTITGTVAGVENAFDNDLTKTVVIPANGYILYDFGEGNTKVIRSFIINANNSAWLNIWGSNNNVNWTSIVNIAISGSTTPPPQFASQSTNITAYRYYKFEAANPLNIARIIGYSCVFRGVYDADNYKFGTTSAYFTGVSSLRGSAVNVSQIQLRSLDWHYRGFIRFDSISGIQSLIAIGVNQIDLQATTTGLRVRYSTNGIDWITVDSLNVSWNSATWYFISVRRTDNTLYFFVDNIPYGTVDLTDVSLFPSTESGFYMGCSSQGLDMFKGNMDEIEFFVGSCTSDSIPTEARSTAFLPATSWESDGVEIPSNITNVHVSMFLDEVQFMSFGEPEVNTDLNFYLSIDNGNVFNKIILTRSGSFTSSSGAYQGRLSCTGISNTNKLVYKITNIFGKGIKLDGVIILWS